MKTLDLHGIQHAAVQCRVEDFIFSQDTPLKVITGNSSRMQELVMQILDRHNFAYHYENDYNLGSLIIVEKTR
jgi:hypothetical protein